MGPYHRHPSKRVHRLGMVGWYPLCCCRTLCCTLCVPYPFLRVFCFLSLATQQISSFYIYANAEPLVNRSWWMCSVNSLVSQIILYRTKRKRNETQKKFFVPLSKRVKIFKKIFFQLKNIFSYFIEIFSQKGWKNLNKTFLPILQIGTLRC